jgi:hypothetical protein
MIGDILVVVPCKPVVKQYILNRYSDPVIFPKRDWLKLLFHSFLTRAKDNAADKFTLQFYTQSVKFPLSYRNYEHFGNELTNEAIVAINSRIEDEIHQRLFMFYEHFHFTVGYTIKDTARHFQHIYNFPEEIYSIDNILKQFQREIKPNVSQKNIAESVLRSVEHNKKGGNNITKASAQRISALREVYLVSK